MAGRVAARLGGHFRQGLTARRSDIAWNRTFPAPPAVSFHFRTLSSTVKNGLVLGILRETYDKWERRAPLCPHHVKDLLQRFKGGSEREKQLLSDVLVQPAAHRIFTDADYEQAGAKITSDLSRADLILGVKRVSDDDEALLSEKDYMFFSHVIKGQPENMPLLQSILDKNVRLFDYECIVEGGLQATSDTKEKKKRRLVAFGKYAGIAGMIDTFQALGRRLLASGYSTPFLNCPPAYMYHDLNEAKEGLKRMGYHITRENELPPELEPLIFAFTGSGNVTKGALEIFELLPHKMIKKEDLKELRSLKSPQTCVYGLLVEQEDIVCKKNAHPGEKVDVAHYRENPTEYRSVFHEEIAPYINVLVNGIYWDERYPRLLTKQQMRELYKSGNKRLFTVADISCDVNGSIEFLERTTTVEQPYFQYNPIVDEVSEDITGDGVAVMGVDILPTELPRESSEHFGDALVPLLEKYLSHDRNVDAVDISQSFEQSMIGLPSELTNACISFQGSLTPRFEYIEAFMKRSAGAEKTTSTDPHVLIWLEGHLFDSGLINQVLDVIENRDCHFDVQECNVRPEAKSSVLVRVSSKSLEELDRARAEVSSLVDLIKNAEATMKCYSGTPRETGKRIKTSDTAVTSEEEQKVLLLGAGRVSASLAEFLGRSIRRNITVASAFEEEARCVAEAATRGRAVSLDVSKDKSGLSRLVKDADVVVSLLPAPMHAMVAEECLLHRVDLVTASYESDEMRSLQQRCEEAGIVILNEVGLDPGMDHMSAMKIIDDIHSRGGKVTSFSSVCGGLPAPEDALNPMMYKFSWSPMGVLSACKNDAIYRRNGDIVEVDGADLLAAARPFEAWPTLNLETLPNRNSLVYGDTYGIQDAPTIFRGTLRYRGFSSVMHVFRKMGLLDDLESGGATWRGLLNSLQSKRGNFNSANEFLLECAEGDTDVAQRAAHCLEWLGVTGDVAISQPGSIVRSFCDVLDEKLRFEDHERDMILMHHDIQAIFDDGSRETHHSSLQLFGDSEMTAMCKTVGYTAAVGTDLVLSGNVHQKGLLLPTSKEIYLSGLKELEKEGIKFNEEVLVHDPVEEAV